MPQMMMFLACLALLALFLLTLPTDDSGLEEVDDDWDSHLNSMSRMEGRGFGGRGHQRSRREFDREEGEGDGGSYAHKKHTLYYQEGLLQRLLQVEPMPVQTPYLPSVQVRDVMSLLMM